MGPVAVVIEFKTKEEVIEMANDTDYLLYGRIACAACGPCVSLTALEFHNLFVESRISLALVSHPSIIGKLHHRKPTGRRVQAIWV